MDFRRIELIFLAVFIALDIFLFTSYKQANNVVTSKSDVASISTQMKSANITTGRLSNEKQKGYYLSATPDNSFMRDKDQLKDQDVTEQGDGMISRLKNTIYLDDTSDAKKTLNKFMENSSNVMLTSSYKYNPYLSNDRKFVYSQVTNYGELFDESSQIVFTRSNKSILNYRQTLVSKVTSLREEQDTISEKEAVDRLYTASEIPDNSKIMWTKYAYSKLLTVKGNVIYIPTWFVEVKNRSTKISTIKTVNAFNGTIIKQNDQ